MMNSTTDNNKPRPPPSFSVEKEAYDKARTMIEGGTSSPNTNSSKSKSSIFHFVSAFYSERKLATFMLNYFAILCVVFVHYGLTTGNEVWEVEMYYLQDASGFVKWFVTRFALFEAGGVNSNLAMIVGLPLTMCHLTISYLSETSAATFVPFKRLQRVHITLGYLMYWTFTAFIVTFIPFILVLSNQIGGRPVNLAFNNSMFITGYMIYTCMLVMAITSAWRFKIRYEIFYYTHQLSLVLFVLWICHTLGPRRDTMNQCYPWVTPPFLYYISDRLCMKFFHKNTTPLVEATLIDEPDGASDTKNGSVDAKEVTSNSQKAMILRIQRPTLYDFKAGQYAYLKCSAIDKHWHPFSILSDPDNAQHLEFFVGVVGNQGRSWSDRLYTLIQDASTNPSQQVVFEVQGPYGVSLGNPDEYSHVCSIGSGTGIVPVISLLKNHIGRLLRLDPDRHIAALEENCDKIIKHEEARRVHKGSVGSKIASGLRLRRKKGAAANPTAVQVDSGNYSTGNSSEQNSLMKMKLAALKASRAVYGKVLLSFMPMAGIALIGFTLSWNTTPIPEKMVPWSYPAMRHTAMILSTIYQAVFAIVALGIWNANSLGVFMDFLLVIITPFADWLWFDRLARFGKLEVTDMILYTLLMGYFVFRSWFAVVKPHKKSWKSVTQISGVNTLQRLDAIWTVRSASMAAQVLPEIESSFSELVKTWGLERAHQVCRIKVFVTSKDQNQLSCLKNELANTYLEKAGCIVFGRPNLAKIIEEHTLEVTSKQSHSYTLLSFCGSVEMSSHLQSIKVGNDMIKTVMGYGANHQMEYESECRAGASKSKSINSNTPSSSPNKEINLDKEEDIDTALKLFMTKRRTVVLNSNSNVLSEILEGEDDDENNVVAA